MPDDGAALPLKNQFGSASEGGEGEEQGEEEGEEEGDADIEWVSMREEWDRVGPWEAERRPSA